MTIKTCFTKVQFLSINGGRHIAGWLVRKYNCAKVVLGSNSHLVTPAGSGIYGMLVSGDTARHWF
jgi:hypothetical protein